MKSVMNLFILLAIFLALTCHAETHNKVQLGNWKTECAGQYQFNVPGEVEVALTIVKKLLKPNDVFNEFRFKDGVVAPYSHLITEYGEMYVTSQLKNEEFANLKVTFKSQTEQRIKELNIEGDKAAADSIQIYNTDLPNGFIRVSSTGATIFVQDEGRIFKQTGGIENQSGKQFAEIFLKNFHTRSLYELPKQSGVCIPYGFIADDGTNTRDIAVTMRLIDHPDVEIFFHDKTGLLSDGTLHEPKDDIKYFWTVMYKKFAKLMEADARGYHTIKMGEQQGTGLFVTINRQDGSKDYGYIAIVKGDPDAKTDTPAQMLYVIRTASRAKGKPVSKEELKDMSEKIVASVKRHPVQ